MHQILALLVLAAVLGGAFAFGSHVTGRVAQNAAPGAARVARGVQRGGQQARQQVVDKTREIWAQARADDWTARRQRARDRRDARPPLRQQAASAGRAAASAARWAKARGRPAEPPAGASPTGTAPAPAPQPAAPAPAPQPRPPVRRPAPPSPGRTEPVTTPAGAPADLFTAVQHLIARANAGGLQSKQRAAASLAEALDYIQMQVAAWAAGLAEPGNNYPAIVWEPLTTTAAYIKAAAGSAGESSSAFLALAGMTVGELAVSPTRAPHHDELNKDAA